jgi:predicted DCC family thiol-disulfide oxidoreductase YuxK
MGAPDTVTHGQPEPVILFDGLCNLCSGSVQFVIKRDPQAVFKFASLQSPYGQEQLKRFGLPTDTAYSVILIMGDKFYQRSNAALEITRRLSGGWPLLYGFKIVPRFIRDAVYNFIGSNRYRFFGKKDSCWIPTPDLKSRFKD